MTSSSATRLPSTGRVVFRRASRAFTLLEVVIALALLGLVATLFVSAGGDLIRAREETGADVFWKAVQAARLQAVQEDTTVVMRFDEREKRLVWSSAAAAGQLDWPGKNLEFLPTGDNYTVLLAGQLVETGRMTAVRFYADGGVDRFRAQLTDKAGQVTRLDLDPWTCAPVLRDPKKT